MPKAAWTLAWSAASDTYAWSGEPGGEVLSPVPDSPTWFAGLAELPSFAFHGKNGSYTARQERRGRDERYWYAYLRLGQKLHKKYLGKTAELTFTRLEQVARVLHAEQINTISPGTAFPTQQAHHEPTRRPQSVITPTQKTTDVPVTVVKGHTAATTSMPAQPLPPLLSTKLYVPRLPARLVP